eukprot:gene6105-4389_t
MEHRVDCMSFKYEVLSVLSYCVRRWELERCLNLDGHYSDVGGGRGRGAGASAAVIGIEGEAAHTIQTRRTRMPLAQIPPKTDLVFAHKWPYDKYLQGLQGVFCCDCWSQGYATLVPFVVFVATVMIPVVSVSYGGVLLYTYPRFCCLVMVHRIFQFFLITSVEASLCDKSVLGRLLFPMTDGSRRINPRVGAVLFTAAEFVLLLVTIVATAIAQFRPRSPYVDAGHWSSECQWVEHYVADTHCYTLWGYKMDCGGRGYTSRGVDAWGCAQRNTNMTAGAVFSIFAILCTTGLFVSGIFLILDCCLLLLPLCVLSMFCTAFLLIALINSQGQNSALSTRLRRHPRCERWTPQLPVENNKSPTCAIVACVKFWLLVMLNPAIYRLSLHKFAASCPRFAPGMRFGSTNAPKTKGEKSSKVVALSCFSFLFSELCTRAYTYPEKVRNLEEVERRLTELGSHVGERLMMRFGMKDGMQHFQRPATVEGALRFLTLDLWRQWFGKQADDLQRESSSDRFFILDSDPTVLSFVDPTPDYVDREGRWNVNYASFMGGVAKGALRSIGFDGDVLTYHQPEQGKPHQSLFRRPDLSFYPPSARGSDAITRRKKVLRDLVPQQPSSSPSSSPDARGGLRPLRFPLTLLSSFSVLWGSEAGVPPQHVYSLRFITTAVLYVLRYSSPSSTASEPNIYICSLPPSTV